MSWKDELPEDIKSSPALKDIPDVATLAKSLIDTQAHLGRSMSLPSEEWTPEQRADWDAKVLAKADGRIIKAPDLGDPNQSEEFYRSIGKPESADNYSMIEGIELEDGMQDAIRGLRNKLHKAHVTDTQQKIILEDFVNEHKAQIDEVKQGIENNTDRLKTEWGQNLDRKIEDLADKLSGVQAPSALIDALKEKTLDASTALFFDRILNQMKGEKRTVSKDEGGAGLETPAGIDAQIAINDQQIATILSGPQTPAAKMAHKNLVDANLKLRLRKEELK